MVFKLPQAWAGARGEGEFSLLAKSMRICVQCKHKLFFIERSYIPSNNNNLYIKEILLYIEIHNYWKLSTSVIGLINRSEEGYESRLIYCIWISVYLLTGLGFDSQTGQKLWLKFLSHIHLACSVLMVKL